MTDEAIVRGTVVPHLRAWRLARGFGVADLATAAGVSRSTVQRAEGGGEIRFVTVQALARVLDTTSAALLAGPPPPSVIASTPRHGPEHLAELLAQYRDATAHLQTLAGTLDPSSAQAMSASGAAIEAVARLWVRLRVEQAATSGRGDA